MGRNEMPKGKRPNLSVVLSSTAPPRPKHYVPRPPPPKPEVDVAKDVENGIVNAGVIGSLLGLF